MKTIFTCGQVFTGTLPLQEAFSVENGCIAEVGSNEQLLASRRPEDEVVTLGGRFVCPGFNDSHMHVLNYGTAMEQCDLTAITGSLAQMQEGLKQFIAQKDLPKDAWVLGRGWNQDCFVPATGMPTRWDLDAVSTEHPVCVVRCCGHCLTVNSRALEVLGIDEHTSAPEGGSIEKDGSGRLNGIFLDNAMPLVQGRFPPPTLDDLKRRICAVNAALNARGITSCHTDDLCTFDSVPWQQVIQAYQELEKEGKLTVRIYEQSQLTTPEALRAFLAAGFHTGAGSRLFKIGPLKMLGDGSLGARTAFLSGSYADQPGEKGIAIFTQEQFDEMIGIAREGGMQVAVHTIGDGILDRVLNSYEKLLGPEEDHRCGVVHVQLTRDDQLERMRRLKLHAYAQTVFIDYDAHIVYQRAGQKLADSSYAFHTMRKMGMHVSNGTDCPVEAPDPMRGIQCAVTRQPLDGSLPPYRPEERMTVEEALASYTAEGAYASFEEDFKGRLLPGMAADFTILSDNPFAVAPQTLHAIRAVETWMDGKKVFG